MRAHAHAETLWSFKVHVIQRQCILPDKSSSNTNELSQVVLDLKSLFCLLSANKCLYKGLVLGVTDDCKAAHEVTYVVLHDFLGASLVLSLMYSLFVKQAELNDL